MKNSSAKAIALGGVLAGCAMVIMCLVGLIPVATYVCPILCCLILAVVNMICGSRIAWAWYGAVSVLSLLFAPDREAAAVFLALGYYPLIKFKLEKFRLRFLLKMLVFNLSVFVVYAVILRLLGVSDAVSSNESLEFWSFLLLAVLGNLTFLFLDRLLTLVYRKGRKK